MNSLLFNNIKLLQWDSPKPQYLSTKLLYILLFSLGNTIPLVRFYRNFNMVTQWYLMFRKEKLKENSAVHIYY